MPIIKHLKKVWEQTGKKPQQLAELPELPEELRYIYNMYCSLPLAEFSYRELYAWCNLTGTHLTAAEVDLLGQLNQIFLKAHER